MNVAPAPTCLPNWRYSFARSNHQPKVMQAIRSSARAGKIRLMRLA